MAQAELIQPCKVVLIGGSAGSLEVVMTILPKLSRSPDFAIILIMHRKGSNDSQLAELLSSRTTWNVKEAEEKESIHSSTIYLAPGDYHLLIEKDCTFSLDFSEKIHYSRPSIDVTFETAAEALGSNVIAILLSGANRDGVAGLQAVKNFGGITAVQDPSTAEVPYMPQQALDSVTIDHVLTPAGIADFIMK